MAWYNSDNNSCYVIWSRARIYRNIDGMDFSSSKLDKKVSFNINKIGKILGENGFHISDESTPEFYLKYAEMGYVDKGFIESDNDKSLYMNEPCNLALAIGGEDFICISSMLPSFSIEEAYRNASTVEVLLDSEVDFAYSENIGYISPFPLHTGHGVVLSSCIYLPALSGLSEIKKIIKKATMQGYYLHPMTTYNENAGGLYVIEYTPDINTAVNVGINKLSDFIKYIISLEKEYESNVFGNNTAVLNKAWRTIGIMEYSSSICEEEMLSLISNIRLMHCLECSDKLPYLINLASLNKLQAELMNTYIYTDIAVPDILKDGCDKERAHRLNEYIKALRTREVV